MAQNGGARPGAGRKSKAEEQKLIEHLTPMHADAIKALHSNIKAAEPWAVKLFMEYFYGKPQDKVDITSKGEGLTKLIWEVRDYTKPK